MLIEPVEFPEIEVVTRLVRPCWEFIDVKPEDVMPPGSGPIWCPAGLCWPGDEMIEFEGQHYYPHRVLDYLPFQPYGVLDPLV